MQQAMTKQRHAMPHQLFQRAIAIEHEAETYASVGMYQQAGDMRARAGDLRKLAKEASAKMGAMGE